MRTLSATFLSVLLASVLAAPSRADEGAASVGPPEAAPIEAAALEAVEDVPMSVYTDHAAHLATGVLSTAVQLSVYGGCRVLGGDHLPCLEGADAAGRRVAGRPTLDEIEAG